MPQPKLLSKPWASDGLKNNIPAERNGGLAQEAATYAEGFPSITMTPISVGGKPPSGKDMNGVLYEISAHTVWQNQGGRYRFDQAFCDAIGGYPKGAVLINDTLDTEYISLVDANTHNPNNGGNSGKWEFFSGRYFYNKILSLETDINKMLIIGRIDLLPFRPGDLQGRGWYHANGDRYGINTAQGEALLALPEYYRTAFNIAASGGFVNLPNMYHNDGRGYFLRASQILGKIQGDAIRNITGSAAAYIHDNDHTTQGALSVTDKAQRGLVWQRNEDNYGVLAKLNFNASAAVPTADENRPLNIGFTPAIYLGV